MVTSVVVTTFTAVAARLWLRDVAVGRLILDTRYPLLL